MQIHTPVTSPNITDEETWKLGRRLSIGDASRKNSDARQAAEDIFPQHRGTSPVNENESPVETRRLPKNTLLPVIDHVSGERTEAIARKAREQVTSKLPKNGCLVRHARPDATESIAEDCQLKSSPPETSAEGRERGRVEQVGLFALGDAVGFGVSLLRLPVRKSSVRKLAGDYEAVMSYCWFIVRLVQRNVIRRPRLQIGRCDSFSEIV